MKNFLIALGFRTKIPISKKILISDKNLSESIVFFPLAGLLLGLILALLNTLLGPIMPAGLVNISLILALTLLTGALHLDGFADTIDGFSAKTNSKEDILAIMRDSRIGAMGVIGLVILLLFKFEASTISPADQRTRALSCT